MWGDFRRSVLERCQRDIETHTDLAFDIEYVKTGQEISELIIRLRKEGGSEIATLPGTDKHRALKGLLDLGLAAKEADNVLRFWWDEDRDRLNWHLAMARKKKADGKVRNAVDWFLVGMKKDFREQRSLFADMQRKALEGRAHYKSEKTAFDAGLQKALASIYAKYSADAVPGEDEVLTS